MQGVILQDGDDEIRATFWNRFNMDFRNLEGSDISISSNEYKGKLVGVTVDEYKGKKQLKVSEGATFAETNQESGGEPIGDSGEERLKEIFGVTDTGDMTASQVREAFNATGEHTPSQIAAHKAIHKTMPVDDPQPARKYVSEETKRMSIEKQTAVNAASAYAAAAGITPDATLELAGRFYEFIHGQLGFTLEGYIQRVWGVRIYTCVWSCNWDGYDDELDRQD